MSWFNFDLHDFVFSFLSIIFEGLPFMLLGTLISGFIDAFLPSRYMTRFLPKNASLAVAMSGGLGVIFPMCECGVVPVVRRLVKKGFPASCAVTYMLAAPIVNMIVVASTLSAFRGQDAMMMTSLRMFLAYALSVLVGLVVQQIPARLVLRKDVEKLMPGRRRTTFSLGEKGAGVAANPDEVAIGDPVADLPVGFRRKLGVAIQSTTIDFIDVMFFFVIGVAIASVFNTAVSQEAILPLAQNPWYATTSLMSLAFLLSLCSTSDAFIAATLVTFPASAKLAFLVYGPMIDVKLVLLYSMVFRKRFVLVTAVGLFVLVALICVRLHDFL